MRSSDSRFGVDPSFDPVSAATAGVVAGVGYLAAMYVDMAVTGSRSDDLLMLGRPLTPDPSRARLLGLPVHIGFGVVVGLIYGAYGRRLLRGPNWWRGIKMLMIENTVMWPSAIVADRLHPSMQSGELPRLNTPIPFAQQLVRHVAFGYLLGVRYGDGRKREASTQ
jgi:hypothetical protein